MKFLHICDALLIWFLCIAACCYIVNTQQHGTINLDKKKSDETILGKVQDDHRQFQDIDGLKVKTAQSTGDRDTEDVNKIKSHTISNNQGKVRARSEDHLATEVRQASPKDDHHRKLQPRQAVQDKHEDAFIKSQGVNLAEVEAGTMRQPLLGQGYPAGGPGDGPPKVRTSYPTKTYTKSVKRGRGSKQRKPLVMTSHTTPRSIQHQPRKKYPAPGLDGSHDDHEDEGASTPPSSQSSPSPAVSLPPSEDGTRLDYMLMSKQENGSDAGQSAQTPVEGDKESGSSDGIGFTEEIQKPLSPDVPAAQPPPAHPATGIPHPQPDHHAGSSPDTPQGSPPEPHHPGDTGGGGGEAALVTDPGEAGTRGGGEGTASGGEDVADREADGQGTEPSTGEAEVTQPHGPAGRTPPVAPSTPNADTPYPDEGPQDPATPGSMTPLAGEGVEGAAPPGEVPVTTSGDAGEGVESGQGEGEGETDGVKGGEGAAEGVKEGEGEHEIVAPKKDEDMPSFDEWREKRLAEQAEQEKSKLMEAQGAPPSIQSSQKQKTTSKKINYASATCGAKVLHTNAEVANPSAVLSENRDSYMNNPCTARKWFTTELCAPVRIQLLEMGNLELFSSMPEKFIVHVSDRYPTKDWKPMGTFHARDERAIQSFTVEDQELYAQYVKVEMLSHYGSEHYCPLTVLRLFGSTIEDEAEETDPEEHTEDDAAPDPVEKKARNLFTSATDTVLSLVKTVLSPGMEAVVAAGEDEGEAAADALGGEAAPQGRGGDMMKKVVDMKGLDSANSSFQNTSAPTVESERGAEAQPCVPQAESGDATTIQEPNVQPPDKPEVPDVTTSPDEVLPKEAPTPPIVTKIDQNQDSSIDTKPSEGAPSSPGLVTLIETPPSATLSSAISRCMYCTKRGLLLSCESQSLCSYINIWRVVTRCSDAATPTTAPARKSTSGIAMPGDVTSSESAASSAASSVASSDTDSDGATLSPPTVTSTQDVGPFKISPDDLAATPSEAGVTIQATPVTDSVNNYDTARDIQIEGHPDASKGGEPLPDGVALEPSLDTTRGSLGLPATSGGAERVQSVPSHVPTQPLPTHATMATTQAAESGQEKSDSSTDTTQKQGHRSDTHIGPDVAQVRPLPVTTPVIDNVATDEIVDPSGKEPIIGDSGDAKPADGSPAHAPKADHETTTGSGPPVPPDDDEKKDTNGLRDIYAHAPGSIDDLDLETVAPPTDDGDVQYQKLSSNKKDTTFMRLKNKINTLEHNLTLSSQYLEELSRRYKRQMEEMYISLNKTIWKLTNTSKTAGERDTKQQAQIADLQSDLRNLTALMVAMQEDQQELNRQVIERHLYLMVLEAAIFLLVLAWCLNRQEKQLRGPRPRASAVTAATAPVRTKSSHSVTSSISAETIPDWTQQEEDAYHSHLLRRRNSSEATPPRDRSSSSSLLAHRASLDHLELKKSGSDSNLASLQANGQDTVQPWEAVPKKRKKKKQGGSASHVKSLSFGGQQHLVKGLTDAGGSGLDQSKPQGQGAPSAKVKLDRRASVPRESQTSRSSWFSSFLGSVRDSGSSDPGGANASAAQSGSGSGSANGQSRPENGYRNNGSDPLGASNSVTRAVIGCNGGVKGQDHSRDASARNGMDFNAGRKPLFGGVQDARTNKSGRKSSRGNRDNLDSHAIVNGHFRGQNGGLLAATCNGHGGSTEEKAEASTSKLSKEKEKYGRKL